MGDCKAVEYSSKSVCDYVAGQLGIGLQPSPDLRLEAAVRENLGDQAELTGLNRRQLLVEQQHLAGLKTGDSQRAHVLYVQPADTHVTAVLPWLQSCLPTVMVLGPMV